MKLLIIFVLKKNMAVPILAAVGLAASLAGSIYSASKSADANAEKFKYLTEQDRIAQELAKKREAQADALLLKEGDFMNTAQGKVLVTTLNDQYDDALKNTTSNGMKAGQTDEAKIANTQALNKSYTDGLSKIGQMGTAYRMGVLGLVNSLRNSSDTISANATNNYLSGMYNLAEGKNQSALNLGENVSNVGNQLISSGDALEKTTKEKKGKESSLDGEIVDDTESINKRDDFWGLGNPYLT